MKRKNLTRNALFTSIISLLLCVSMLVGTTFAWFTDSATTGVNKITAGNLDIGVYYAFPSDVVDGDIPADSWKPVEADKSVFDDNALWEPGYTQIVFFKIANEGSLALQYQMNVDVLKEVLGKTKAGADIQLSNYIEAYACVGDDWSYKGNLFTTREQVVNPKYAPAVFHGTLSTVANMAACRADNPYENALSLDTWEWLEPEEKAYVSLALWMPTTVGNEANHDGSNIPAIDLGISVVATQYNWENEKDAFDQNYDKDAVFPNVATTANDLTAALAQDENVVLANDITFTGVKQMPDRNNYVEVYGNKTGFAQYGGVLDGNGFKLIDGEGDKSYVVVTHGGTIKNLTIESGARGIVTYSPTEDVYIDNVVVDGAGYALNSTEQTAVNMVVTNSTINGWTSLAGFKSVSFNNCKLGENSLKYWQGMGYGQDFDRLFRVYSPTTYTRCEFEQGYYLDLSAGGTATLIDCTVNGVEITAENYAQYITIELPTGGNLADCVNFK